MKIGLFSDLHLHKWMSFGVDEYGLSVRLGDQMKVLEQIKKNIIEYKIDKLAFGGDLYHKVGEIPVECINVAHEFFAYLEREDIPCLMVDGNHDLINRKSPHWYHSAVRPFDNTKEYEGVKIKIVNYMDVIDYTEIRDYDIVILHKQPTLVNDYGIKFDGADWETLAANNKLVFFGHYHERMFLSGNCFIMGSVMPLTFADTNDRGMWIVDTDNWTVEFIPIQSPKFITVDTPDQVVKDDGNYYRVLHADKRVDDPNVVTVVEPQYFEERLKSCDFMDILNEWVQICGKNKSYIDAIADRVTSKMHVVNDVFDGRLMGISIIDFLSIGEIEYNVVNGFTLVSGRNDIFDSNGSGKTSMFEAVYWCLFGETTKGLTGNDVVRRGLKDCNVSLKLISENKRFSVTRSRKNGLSILLDGGNGEFKDVADGYKLIDAQKILESLLGFDKTIFLSSCYFSQESLSMFTMLGDADRTNMITKLLGFEKYDDLYVMFKDSISEARNQIEDSTKTINLADTNMAIAQGKLDTLEGQMADINDDNDTTKKRIDLLKKELTELNNAMFKINEKKDAEADVVDFDKELESLNGMEDDANIAINEWRKKSNKFSEDIAHNQTQRMIKVTESNGFTASIKQLKSEINHFENLQFGERCDKCASIINESNTLVFIESKNKDISLQEETVALFNEAIKTYDKESSELASAKADADKHIESLDTTVIKKEIREVNERKDNAILLSRAVEVERTRIQTSMTDKEGSVYNYETDYKNNEDKFTRLNHQTMELDKSIHAYKEEIKLVKEGIAKVETLIDIEEFWKIAFSSTGIRSLLIDRFCNEFNRIANEYLSTASNGVMSVTMTPTKVLKSGESRNKLGFDIMMGDVSVKYESLSGGEKKRVDVSLCLSINKWISMKMGVKHGLLGMMVLDELFSGIDSLGEESIATLLNEEGKCKAVFVIDHALSLSSYADRIITIVKELDVSRLEHTFEYENTQVEKSLASVG